MKHLTISCLCCLFLNSTNAQSVVNNLLQDAFVLIDEIIKSPQIVFDDFEPDKVEVYRKKKILQKDFVVFVDHPTDRTFKKRNSYWGGDIILNTSSMEITIQGLWGTWVMISTERIVFFQFNGDPRQDRFSNSMSIYDRALGEWITQGSAVVAPENDIETQLECLKIELRSILEPYGLRD
jgi:hypothetical protein